MPALGLGLGSSRGRRGARTNSAEAQQFFNRLMPAPSPVRQVLYASLIDTLVAAGVWAKLDRLAILAAADAPTSLVDLVSTTALAASATVFTADRGWTTVGLNSCILSNFNPSVGGNYTQNSAMVCCWNLSTGISGSQLWRTDADLNVLLYPYVSNGGNKTQAIFHGTAGVDYSTPLNPGDASGLFMTNRTASNAWTLLRNNTVLASPTHTSTTPEDGNLKIGFGVYQPAAYAMGGALTVPQQTALYNALQTYLHAVGAV